MSSLDLKSMTSGQLESLIEQALNELAERAAQKEHLDNQFGKVYMYLVGEWAGSHKAKSTRNGRFVPNQEVIRYLS
jgi:hypothetical protein